MNKTELTSYYKNFGEYARSLFAYNDKMPKFVISSPENQNALAETCFSYGRPTYIILNHIAYPFMDEDEITNIVRHEIAHVMAGLDAGHGPQWEDACHTLGIYPHQFFTIRRVNEWLYATGFAMRPRSEFREPTLGW